jgi:O-succinylbenzoic acid--CoA ligase
LPGVELSLLADSRISIRGAVTDNQEVITNDIGQWIVPGQRFVVLGRADRVINTGGLKVSAEWLEELLAPTMVTHYPNQEYCITWLPSNRWGQEIVLVLAHPEVLSDQEEHRWLPEEWQQLVSQKVSIEPAKRPKRLLALRTLPKTDTGKVNHKAVQALALRFATEA